MTSFTLKIGLENAQISESDFGNLKIGTSVTSAASNFQELFVMQFDAKSGKFEEKSVHETIIRATLSFLYLLLTSYSSILQTVLSCGTMSSKPTFQQHIQAEDDMWKDYQMYQSTHSASHTF